MDGVFQHIAKFPIQNFYLNPQDCYLGALEEHFGTTRTFSNTFLKFIRDVFYWVDTFNIDGIRFDYTLGYFKQNEKGPQLLKDIQSHLDEKETNFVTISI
jgi:1,4-alpha-glucan branching enzyme